MQQPQTRTSDARAASTRTRQGQSLQSNEVELRKLASQQNKQDFFKLILPQLKPLKSYIKRRLRIAYLTLQIRTPVLTSGDILDEVIFKAYENLDHKPPNLSLEEWLYRLANDVLHVRLRERSLFEARRRSLETLSQAELRTLEERMTADAEGEPYLVEDLDDGEYQQRDFIPPESPENPETELERKETLMQISRALTRVPPQDRIVFELFVIERLTKEAVSRITGVAADEVPKIAERVRAQVRQELQSGYGIDQQKVAS